jgi:hypothetical protein
MPRTTSASVVAGVLLFAMAAQASTPEERCLKARSAAAGVRRLRAESDGRFLRWR